MFSKWSRVAVPVLALALAACGPAAKTEQGSLNVTVSALGGVAGKVFIQVTPSAGAPLPLVEATAVTPDKFTATILQVPAGTYTVFAWGYSPEQVAAGQAVPPAAAKYETRGTLPSFTVLANQGANVRVVLTEATSTTTSHAPYSNFIAAVGPAIIYPGDLVAIHATAFDPDGNLLSWKIEDPGAKGTFLTPSSGALAGFESVYAADWTANAGTAGVVSLRLTVSDAAGNSAVVNLNITIAAPPETVFSVEIDAAPTVAQGLFTTDGQILEGTSTSFSSTFASDEALSAAWSNDCAGTFSNEALAGNTASATFTAPAVMNPDLFGVCYVTLTVTDASGSVVIQNLGIVVGPWEDPVVPPVL